MDEAELLAQVFPGDTEMAHRMRRHDWSDSVLGPVSAWPQSLRTVLHIMLSSQHPMFLWWGPELIQFYNDGYLPSFGRDRHLHALGARGKEFWSDIWSIIGPEVEGVMERGISTWHTDHLVPIFRNGRMQEVYWTYSYSPVLHEDRSVGGTLVIVQETTSRVLTERRMTMLHVLAERMATEGETVAKDWQLAAEVMHQNDGDFAFALLYAFDDSGPILRLAGKSGIVPPELCPPTLDTSAGEANQLPWDVTSSLDLRRATVVSSLSSRHPALISERWQEPVDTAMVLPIALNTLERPLGVLIAGISPRLELDAGYRNFIGLVASQLASEISNRRVLEDMKAAGSMKDQFLSLVSHELRVPISTVVGSGLMLLKYSEVLSDEDRKQALEGVVAEGERVQRVIENLLLITRMEASAHSPFRDVPIETIISRQVEALAQRRPERRITVTEAASQVRVTGEETLIGMVLENLIGNADKYSPPDTPIEVSATARDDGMLEVRVRDFGIGVSASDAGNLFSPFFRSADARQYATGMGLGLAVCKRIVDAHGGQIWVERRPGRGTDFVFTLPLAR